MGLEPNETIYPVQAPTTASYPDLLLTPDLKYVGIINPDD